jgi:hypothetical protein
MSGDTAREVQAIYQEVARLMMRRLPEGWRSARVRAEIHDDDSVIEGRYFGAASASGSGERSFALGRDGRVLFEKLREVMGAVKGDYWKVMLFQLDRTGTFSTDFDYDDGARWNESDYRSHASEQPIP